MVETEFLQFPTILLRYLHSLQKNEQVPVKVDLRNKSANKNAGKRNSQKKK